MSLPCHFRRIPFFFYCNRRMLYGLRVRGPIFLGRLRLGQSTHVEAIILNLTYFNSTVLYPENRCAVFPTTVTCLCVVHRRSAGSKDKYLEVVRFAPNIFLYLLPFPIPILALASHVYPGDITISALAISKSTTASPTNWHLKCFSEQNIFEDR